MPSSEIQKATTMALDEVSVPRIARDFRLQWEPAQNAYVLLYPEGMVKLNGSAGEILKRCDGTADVRAIVIDLETAFETEALTADVLSFLQLAANQNWVEFK
jgi:pyrroloquinoline quinone biosynthesis protein D